ncbi:MAG: nitronate monooxygenase, partial [Clostridiales bacterium]|nr:nitronate monooxygenase [Clostridiales bacterium]
RGLASALILGAVGISMGTRFMNSVESPVHENQKKAANATDVYSTIYTDKVDGMLARVMDTEGARKLIKKRLNPLSSLILSKKIAKMLGFPWLKLAIGIMFMGYKRSMQMARMAIGFDAFMAGTMEGDNKKGVLPIGQVAGIMHETLTVKEIIERTVKEAKKMQDVLAAKMK